MNHLEPTVPAGDAGLERRTVDVDALRRRLAEVGELAADYGATIHVDGEVPLAAAVLHLAKSVPLLLNEIDRLQAQLAAQQTVVDAARDYRQSVIDMMHVMETGGDAWRMARERRVNAESRMLSGLAALDAGQAAQPEGERACGREL